MKIIGITTRLAKLDDLSEMQKMFVDTISTICKFDYSPEQIKVWTSSIKNALRWTDKLSTQYFRIAVFEDKIVGYASLSDKDYLDMFYVHKDYQRQGIASKLYSEIEKEAIKNGAKTLHTDVSKTARAFFETKGYIIISPQTIIIQDTEIINYKMIKKLL